jgi:hypothetical protein
LISPGFSESTHIHHQEANDPQGTGPIMAVKQTENNKIGKGKAGPGRPKGSVNKTTALLKDSILEAAGKAGGADGIVGYLTLQAQENPGPFMSLLGKVLPVDMTTGGDKIVMPHEIILRAVVDPSND